MSLEHENQRFRSQYDGVYLCLRVIEGRLYHLKLTGINRSLDIHCIFNTIRVHENHEAYICRIFVCKDEGFMRYACI